MLEMPADELLQAINNTCEALNKCEEMVAAMSRTLKITPDNFVIRSLHEQASEMLYELETEFYGMREVACARGIHIPHNV
jgi:hypothetical protein